MKKLKVNFAAVAALLAGVALSAETGTAAPKAMPPSYLGSSVYYQLVVQCFTEEGTIAAATKKLPFLKDAGVDVVLVSPIVEMDRNPDPASWSPRQRACGVNSPLNPWRISDFYKIDPVFGTADDFKAFVAEAHRLGLKACAEIAFNLIGSSATFVKEHPGCVMTASKGRDNLLNTYPAFLRANHSDPWMRDYFLKNYAWYFNTFNVDGFRYDYGDGLPADFRYASYAYIKSLRPESVTMSETFQDPRSQPGMFDLNYCDYNWGAIQGLAARKLKVRQFVKNLQNTKKRYGAHFRRVNAFDHHDIANNASMNTDDKHPQSKARMNGGRWESVYGQPLTDGLLAFIFTMEGVPMLYCGQEIADSSLHCLFGVGGRQKHFIDWKQAETPAGRERLKLVKFFSELRHANPDFFDGPCYFKDTEYPDDILFLVRSLKAGEFRTAINFSEATRRIRLMPNCQLLVSAPGVSLEGDFLTLPSRCWAVLKRVTSSEVLGRPPSDAIVLFDGTQKSLDENWCDNRGGKSRWKCVDGAVESTRGAGNLCSRRKFADVQLHVEWRTPLDPGTNRMNRGNSGVFLFGDLYEVQVFESYETNPADMKFPFYADGQAASIYGQNPPLVNPTRKPGEWQAYDIVFHPPVFKDNACVHPATLTVFLNGVLVQDHWELEGPTWHCKRTYQVKPKFARDSIQFQEHNCPVRFRNVWVRELPSRHRARP